MKYLITFLLVATLTGCNTTRYLTHAAKKTGDAYCETDPITRSANRAFLTEALKPNRLVMTCAVDTAAAEIAGE